MAHGGAAGSLTRMTTDDWETQVDAVWASSDDLTDAALIARIDALAAERPADDPVALFHAAGARDSAGLEDDAEPLYRRALDLGLEEPLRGEATIQLASTLRNLERVDEAIALLEALVAEEPRHPLADSANAFLALCLSSRGDDRGALALALTTLAPLLPRYARSVEAYAGELLDD
jgi:tetratricopeptide (TPR) repeat protein